MLTRVSVGNGHKVLAQIRCDAVEQNERALKPINRVKLVRHLGGAASMLRRRSAPGIVVVDRRHDYPASNDRPVRSSRRACRRSMIYCSDPSKGRTRADRNLRDIASLQHATDGDARNRVSGFG